MQCEAHQRIEESIQELRSSVAQLQTIVVRACVASVSVASSLMTLLLHFVG